ncbi:MAG: LytTR family DNA-binding domain-containing protein [Oscillospiraceae bacterium]
MIRICICDDTIKDLENIEKLAKSFAANHPELPFILRKFQSPYDLLDCIEEIGCFDLFLLDVIMPNIDGLELGKKIRKRKEACEIIYLTTSREYGVDAFGVGASDYLLKPVKKDDFEHAILKAIEKLMPTENPSLVLKTKSGIRKLRIRDIVFIESFNHYRLVKLISGEHVITDKTIAALSDEILIYPNFKASHRAYIVNLDYVNGIVDKTLLMPEGYSIPISKNSYVAFKNAYLEYTIIAQK